MTPRTVLITGTSSGLGRAFAEEALRLGWNVAATARNPDKLLDLIARAPQRALALALDVDRPETFDNAIDAVKARFGRIDVLINNAGYGLAGAVEETPLDEWQAMLRTNLLGPVGMIRAVLPTMREQRDGTIVNISSQGGQLAFAGFSAYCATKFALEGMSEALADEMKHFGIRVLIVEPGEFRTGFFAAATSRQLPATAAYAEAVAGARRVVQGPDGARPGDPAKAAQAVFKAIGTGNPPLRLALGNDAIDNIRAHAEGVLQDLADWEHVGRATVHG